MSLKALVIRASGTNCDLEMCRGFERAGAQPELIHVDALIRDPARTDAFGLIGIPGGFSHGDDIAAGRIFATKLREQLYPALRAAAVRGVPMIGACNGFQVLVQVGLLPGPDLGIEWPVDRAPAQRIALCDNASARFTDRWVGVEFEARSVCVWTRGIAARAATLSPASVRDAMQLPVAHGEGRLVTDSPDLMPSLERRGQIVFRYGDNYNGSEGAVGGVCDSSGRIFGLMPHPERFLDWTRHPYWTRLDAKVRATETIGMMMFRNAVDAAREATVSVR